MAWSPAEAKLEQYAADELAVEQGKIRVRAIENKPEIIQREQRALQDIRSAGALELAPPIDGYDYAGAGEKGYTFEPDESGNIQLPNEFYRPGQAYVSGYDIGTGEKVMDSPADVASRDRRRQVKFGRQREMNFMEWAGCVLAEGEACPVDGAMGVVQQGGRIVSGAGLSFFEGMREMAELGSAGVLDLPEIAQIPDMGPWEGTGASMLEFLSGYGLVGKGLQATGAAAKLAPVQVEAIKDVAATFAMNPSGGNLVNLGKSLGWLDEEDAKWLDAEFLAKSGQPLQARLAATATDAGVLGGGAYVMSAGLRKAWGKLQAFYAKLAAANEELVDSVDRMADSLIQRGVERQRQGLSAINAGVPMGAAAGAVEESAGQVVKGAAGSAQRAAETFQAVSEQAMGYMIKGADRESFVTMQAQAGVPAEIAAEAWDAVANARQATVETMPDAARSTVSTRFPTAVKAEEDPMTHDLVVGLESAMADEAAFKHNVELMSKYDNYRRLGARGPKAKAEQLIDHMVDNLLKLHDAVPEQIRNRSRLWYDGANKLAHESAEQYGISPEAASGVYATLSPQKDWFQNVSLGNRVMDIISTKGDYAWNERMDASLDRIAPKIKNKLHQQVIDVVRGKSLDELSHPVERALWVRVYDEGLNDRSYRVVTPEGEYGDVMTTGADTPQTAAWGSLNEIANAAAIMDDQSLENISRRLGQQHKVRNFYNNIIHPRSTRGDVTIDTHAVAAALMQPYSGKDEAVLHNFGSNMPGKRGPANSSITGNKGTYGIFAEAYRRAAAERGLLPREMQSITWEAVRGLFKDTLKTAANKKAARDIWRRYKSGEIEQEKAQELLIRHFGGIDAPDWN